MNTSPNISVNIIVKNEEQNIANAIASIQPIATEIIVIDTGSYDKTAENCTRMGCEKFEYDLKIEHFGYQAISEEKLERNTRLLSQELSEEEDDWKYYYLAETHFSGGNTIEALSLYNSR